ncbi:MAG: TIGR02584 family CRISPR-associated protein [Verrucomicrobiales bacterium]|nr:TIGR02584 family CRISPR-associated protein [Verrucomicrobiales bacterium]
MRGPTHPTEASRYQGKTILLAVLGTSPAVLTETVWALARPSGTEAPLVPDVVVAIGTSQSASRFLEEIGTAKPEFGNRTVWEDLRAALGTEAEGKLELEPEVRRIRDPETGVSLEDWLTRDDHERAFLAILAWVAEMVRDSSCLIASIAGGRKTMGVLLHSAMTFLCRKQDRITHVLAPPPFDRPAKPGFFFPAQNAKPILTSEGWREPQDARLVLIDVPFVPLRLHPPSARERVADLEGYVRFCTRLMEARQALEPTSIRIDPVDRSIHLLRPAIRIDVARLARREHGKPDRFFAFLRFLIEAHAAELLSLRLPPAESTAPDAIQSIPIALPMALEAFRCWLGLPPCSQDHFHGLFLPNTKFKVTDFPDSSAVASQLSRKKDPLAQRIRAELEKHASAGVASRTAVSSMVRETQWTTIFNALIVGPCLLNARNLAAFPGRNLRPATRALLEHKDRMRWFGRLNRMLLEDYLGGKLAPYDFTGMPNLECMIHGLYVRMVEAYAQPGTGAAPGPWATAQSADRQAWSAADPNKAPEISTRELSTILSAFRKECLHQHSPWRPESWRPWSFRTITSRGAVLPLFVLVR